MRHLLPAACHQSIVVYEAAGLQYMVLFLSVVYVEENLARLVSKYDGCSLVVVDHRDVRVHSIEKSS